LENLVKVGALDAFGKRGDMLDSIPILLQFKRRTTSSNPPLIGDISSPHTVGTYLQVRPPVCPGGFENPPLHMPPPGQDKRESLLAEREILSLDLSAHPLDFCNLDNGITRIKDLPGVATGRSIKIAGSVIRYQTPPTRSGKRVVYVIMEDGTGVADVTVFSDVQDKCGKYLFRSGWLEVSGKIQRRGPKSLSIIADAIKPLRQRI
jgi:DNA polymerase III alpha subunit